MSEGYTFLRAHCAVFGSNGGQIRFDEKIPENETEVVVLMANTEPRYAENDGPW